MFEREPCQLTNSHACRNSVMFTVKNPCNFNQPTYPHHCSHQLGPSKTHGNKFVPQQDFQSNSKGVSLVPSLPNLELADPNILIENRDKPPDENLVIDANDEDDPDDKSFKSEGEGSDSESDDSGTSLEDEDNMESE